MNLPAHKDYLSNNFKWFGSHAKIFGEKNGNNVNLGHILSVKVFFSRF